MTSSTQKKRPRWWFAVEHDDACGLIIKEPVR